MPVPANVPFPAALQVGQGATPNELNIGEPIIHSQGKRFRGRDEWLKAMLTDGVNAPEALKVKGINIDSPGAGSITTPQSFFLSGLSAANGSFTTSIQLVDWRPPGLWRDVLVKAFALSLPTHIYVMSSMSWTQYVRVDMFVLHRLLIDGVEVATIEVGSEWLQGKDTIYHHAVLPWAGALSAGNHTIQFQLNLNRPPQSQPGRNDIQAQFGPNMSIVLF